MPAHAASLPRRHHLASRRRKLPPAAAKPEPSTASANGKASSKPPSPIQASLERMVKKLRLTKPLMLPEATLVVEACRRMAAKRIDAALLTIANMMLSGIVTSKDISGRVIAEGHRPDCLRKQMWRK